MKKMIVSLEGIDGAGKSTVVKMLEEKFGPKSAVYYRTQKCGILNNIVSKPFMKKHYRLQIPVYIILSHVNYFRFLKTANSPSIIIMDRCFLSNICYFFPCVLKSPILLKIALFFEPAIYPGKIFILDVEPAVARKRDGFKKELPWLIKTRNAYLDSAKSELLHKYHISVIRDRYSPEQKADMIFKYINHILEKN